MRQILAIALCLALLLSGCSADTSGKIFRYDVPGAVENLDPQSTTDPTERLILANLMEGLVVRTEGGGVGSGVAESHTVSSDGLRYTFTLRDGAVWRDGTPVTAADFLFSFRRLFSYSTGLAESFSAVRNAREILAGELGAEELGVRAESADTLVFTLAHPDPLFLERLADPAALPCKEEFFLGTKGRYGLEPGSVLTNGPFYLDGWDNGSRIQIRANGSYVSALPAVSAGVNFHIGRQDAGARFLDGATDLALLRFDRQEELDASSGEPVPIEKTVWCVVFNQNHPVWGNPLLRQGLAQAIDREQLGEGLPQGFALAPLLVPGAARMLGRPYRDAAGSGSPLPFDPGEARRLFRMGLGMLGRETLPDNSGLVMPELASASLNAGKLRQNWQEYLSAYLNFTVESPAQIEERFRSGDYQILLMPFTPAQSDVAGVLSAFASDSPQNHIGYKSALYDGLLESAGLQPNVRLAAERYGQAESLLLSDAAVIPLFSETTYLAFRNETEDIVYSPFADLLYFKYARRAE